MKCWTAVAGYRVISGSMLARQRIVDIVEDKRDDGTPCTSSILHPDVVPLIGRPTRPFQGCGYLSPENVPADLDGSVMAMGDTLYHRYCDGSCGRYALYRNTYSYCS